jgi:hypothetical protein
MFRRRRFPVEIILVRVSWYCEYGVSYRDVAALLLADSGHGKTGFGFRFTTKQSACADE